MREYVPGMKQQKLIAMVFRMLSVGPPRRLVLAEAPIDALSLAAIEDCPIDTLYAATAMKLLARRTG